MNAKSEYQLANEIRAAQTLKAALLEVTDDTETLADTIEGATNLHEAITAVMDGITEDEMMIAGLRSMTEQLVNRRLRYENRIDRRRSAIEKAMMVGEIAKLELPQATLSLRKVAPGLDVTDEASIPLAYWKPQPDKLDRTALKDALKGGAVIPGAVLDNGGQALTIRRA